MGLIILFIIFLASLEASAQHAVVVSNNKYNINYQVHRGYIILTNGERIKGDFQYAADEFPTYNLKFFAPNGKIIKRYKSKIISQVALAGSDTSLMKTDSTYFKVLDKRKAFYRQLTSEPVKIYDYYFNVNERHGLIRPPMVVKENGQIKNFNSKEKFIQWMRENY